MSLDLGKMYASVILDDGDFKSGLNRMQNSAESVFKKIGSIAAAYLSWRSIADVTSAFMTQQDAVEGVRSALRNLGRETDANTAKFARFAAEMQKITKYGDESTLAVMSQGMRLGIDPSQIESVTKSAMGLSQKLGIDLPTSMQLLARASHGHTEMLARYGIQLDENLTKEEQYQQILKQGADGFSLVTDAATTARGQIAQMMNALGDSKEVLGGIAAEILLPAATAVKEISTAFNNLDPAMQRVIVSAGTLGAALAALSGLGFLQKANDAIRNLAPTQYLLEAEKAAEAEKRAEYEKTDAMKERHAQAQMLRVARIHRAEAEAAVVSAETEIANLGKLSDIETIHAAETKTAEAEKRAEYEKTDAMRKRHAQAQMLRAAQIKRAEAETMVATAKNNLSGADNPDALSKAKFNLAAAEAKLTKAQIAESQALRKLNEAHEEAMTASGKHAEVLAQVDAQTVAAEKHAEALAQAKIRLSAAQKELTKTQIAESQASQKLTDKHRAAMIAARQHAAAANVNAAAQKNAAASMTVSGRAALFARTAFRGAAAAAKSLVASLGPIGIAMLAISGIVTASRYIQKKFNDELEGSLNLAKQQSSQANELAAAHRKEAEAETSQFQRLQELAKYERLNNAEKTEAQNLIESIRKKYAGLDIQMDTTTGKIRIAAGAWDKLNEAQKKAARSDLLKQQQSAAGLTSALQNNLRNQFGSYWRNTAVNQGVISVAQWLAPKLNRIGIRTNSAEGMERGRYTDEQNRVDDILKLKTAEQQIAGFEKLRNDLLKNNRKTEAQAVDELIKSMQTELKLKKQLESGSTETNAEAGRAAAQKTKEESEQLRRALNELTSTEWEIKFNIADPIGKIKMLDDKIQEIFNRQSGKYANLDAFKNADRAAMNKEELNDLRAILDVEEKRRAIRQQGTRSIEEMNRSDQQDADRRFRSMQEKIFSRQLEQLRKNGELDAVRNLLNQEYQAAKEKAAMLEKQYADAKAKAEADGILTEQENRLLSEARRKMQEAQRRQDSLEEQVYQENKNQKSSQVNAAWSVAALADQLYGNSSTDKQIAQNTSRTTDLLTRIDSKVNIIRKNALSYS